MRGDFMNTSQDWDCPWLLTCYWNRGDRLHRRRHPGDPGNNACTRLKKWRGCRTCIVNGVNEQETNYSSEALSERFGKFSACIVMLANVVFALCVAKSRVCKRSVSKLACSKCSVGKSGVSKLRFNKVGLRNLSVSICQCFRFRVQFSFSARTFSHWSFVNLDLAKLVFRLLF